ncbi:MAG: sulfoxide reductase heme-binding subunit YedZ [Gammaproteobacteria bacterium]|nr:sulfoxide reductase heme-binding subunit YedZ [Gammaproteobacteria bacterium]
MRDRLWYGVFLCGLAPFLWLVFLVVSDGLGANPIERITHFTGDWQLNLLLTTLAMTPLRRLTRKNVFIRFRRMLGLFAFFYVCLHFSTWLVLDQFFDWDDIVRDIAKRPFITVGFTAFLLLIPMAVTSTKKMVQRLGPYWRKLHSCIYVIGTLGIIHYLWLVKADKLVPIIYGSIFVLLLVLRLPVPQWLKDLPPLLPQTGNQPG